MGIGDEIMASGHARVVSERTGKRVRILDLRGRGRWEDVWEGIPWIARPQERGGLVNITNGPQCRPYVAYPFTRERGQRWTDWRARDHVGAIVLKPEETAFAERMLASIGPFIVIEPTILAKSNPNKQWGKWDELAAILTGRGHKVVQLGADRSAVLAGVEHFIRTPSFRRAAAVLSRATAAVLPEGGLHHAAAVLGIPAVVLFGGFISPETTGYPIHINIAEGEPCGMWKPCDHCKEIWARLSPEYVASQLDRLIEAKAA